MMAELWALLVVIVLAAGAAAVTLLRWRATQQAVWTPESVAALLDAWCDDAVDPHHWQALEQARLGEPALEEIRRQAVWATYLGSACVVNCGTPEMRLTDEGRALFRRLSDACHALPGARASRQGGSAH